MFLRFHGKMPLQVFLNKLVNEYCAAETSNSRSRCILLVGRLISGVCPLRENRLIVQADSFRLNIHACACAAECRGTAAPLLCEVLSCCSADL